VSTQKCSLLEKCHTVSRYTCKCNSVYAHTKGTSFSAPILMKLTNNQRHYAQFSPKSANRCGKYGKKFIYVRPQIKNVFQNADIHGNLNRSIKFCGHFMYRIFIQAGGNIQRLRKEFYYGPCVKYGFNVTDFSQHSQLLGDLMCR